jgi:hypothetical protein
MKHLSRWELAVVLPALHTLGAATGDGGPIMMPPFFVEEQRADGIKWLYGADADLQVLSGCATDATAGFLRQIMEQRNELRAFIPDEFLLHASLPRTLIVFPESLKQTMDQALARELEQGDADKPRRFSPMNDLRLSEPDSSYIFIVFDDVAPGTEAWLRGGGGTRPMNLQTAVHSPAYLRFLLKARVPALPDWYVSGCVGLYETNEFKADSGSDGRPSQAGRLALDGARFGTDPWLSEGDASALRRHPDGARPLVPMRELFAARYPSSKSDEYRRVWEAQAELFVRWALSGGVDGGPERLRRFVEGATTQRTTEEFFYSCFGIDYGDALDALSDFLPHAVERPLYVAPGTAPGFPSFDLREATAGEVRRIKGEWSRRVLGVIKEDNPGSLPHFAGKVRASLEGSLARGERDPGFLASLALFRIQNGSPKEGFQLLEQYSGAAAARPMAQLELAQQHLLEALARPTGTKGLLGDEQASELLREISACLNAGPIESAYKLAAKVLEHLGRDPTRSERMMLADGARLFPRDSQLVVQAVSWELRAGEVMGASRLIEFGLWEGADPSESQKLLVLENLARQALAATSPQGGIR